jgi:hypothetical protein
LLLATTAENPYSISKELLSMYLDIDINEMQLYRITDHYGEGLAPLLDNTARLHPLPQLNDVVYTMADGSMILTREEAQSVIRLQNVQEAQINEVKVKGSAQAFVRVEGSNSKDIHLSKNKIPGIKQKIETVKAVMIF